MAKRSYYTSCPRCGSHSFEVLSSYAHCAGCFYFEDYYQDIETCFAAVANALESAHIEDDLGDNDELKDQAA